MSALFKRAHNTGGYTVYEADSVKYTVGMSISNGA